MSYPVTYRNRTSSAPQSTGGGSQRPVPVSPANDNSPVRPGPPPANDNFQVFTPKQVIQNDPFVRTITSNIPRTVSPAQVVRTVGGFTPAGRAMGVASAVVEVAAWWIEHYPQPDLVIVKQKKIDPFPGWTKTIDCGQPPVQYTTGGGFTAGQCGRSQDPNLGPPLVNPGESVWRVNPTANTLWAWNVWLNNGIFNRAYPSQQWSRNVGNTAPVSPPQPDQLPAYGRPARNPNWDPWDLPIAQPVTQPQPWPYHAIPWRQGNGMPESREEGQPANNPWQRPNYNPRHRPPRREHEKKTQGIKGVVGTAQSLAHSLTESLDVLDAVYGALPPKYQVRGNPTPQEKAQAVYNNWRHLDTWTLLNNLVVNHLTDQVIGWSSQKTQQWLKQHVAPYTGNPLGVTLGPRVSMGG